MKLQPSITDALAIFRSAAVPAEEPVSAPTIDAIRATEARLGARLPRSYQVFLVEAGALHIDFWETFLVGSESLGLRNIVSANMALRDDPTVLLPHWLIAFAFDGSGGFYGFDTRHTGPEHEHPVLHCGPETSPDTLAERSVSRYTYFPEWLIEQIATIAA